MNFRGNCATSLRPNPVIPAHLGRILGASKKGKSPANPGRRRGVICLPNAGNARHGDTLPVK
jgi:hypothetical protein